MMAMGKGILIPARPGIGIGSTSTILHHSRVTSTSTILTMARGQYVGTLPNLIPHPSVQYVYEYPVPDTVREEVRDSDMGPGAARYNKVSIR